MKKKTKLQPSVPCMKYHTFVTLRDYIEERKKQIHMEFCTAADLSYEHQYDGISPPKFKRGCKVLPNSVRDFMWENYRRWMRYYDDMLKQLRYAAAESNRQHPNPEMRAFWNLE